MTLREIITWLQPCPVFAGEPLIPNFLPSHKGWSINTDKQLVRTDILGNRSTQRRVKITRRITVPDGEVRLRTLEQLEDLAAWAREHPPADGSIRMTGLPEFQSRASSGTEDFIVYLTLISDE
ncbi:MAG: hypothetical protein II845_02590 [Oscillospiraceae bacterium]|nr:hypothetical protein [Oscillospiraceae bacterium]